MQDVNMNEEEKAKHLEETLLVRVIIITPGGKSHTVPLWFVILNGDIYITTKKSKKYTRKQ